MPKTRSTARCAPDVIAAGTDFIVLTGFLGSGKTTLLRDYLALPEAADTAVIVNEVGEIGLDGAILAEAGGLPIAMLSNGCVCCALGSDLTQTVHGMLADGTASACRRRHASSWRPADCRNPGRSCARSPGWRRCGCASAWSQRSTACAAPRWRRLRRRRRNGPARKTLVLTKRDAVSAAALRHARSAAAGVNPTADLVDLDDRRAAMLAAFSLRPSAPTGGSLLRAEAVALRHPRIGVMLVRLHEPVAWDDLAEWLDNLAGMCGERLLRTKGLVRIAGATQPLLVQSVGTMFAAPRAFADGEQRSFLVLILRDVDTAEIAQIQPALPMSCTVR